MPLLYIFLHTGMKSDENIEAVCLRFNSGKLYC